jgi:two-component system, chemotaxis family, CheB/CheR fusion protein
LLNAQEDERRRIARELHDDLGQRAALASQLVDRMAAASERPSAENQANFDSLKSMINGISDGLREVSHRLHPAIIADLGLPQALSSLVSDYRALGLDLASFIEDVPDTIPLPTATALYRIAQEGFHNILRHAPGAPAKLSLKTVDSQIEMRIEDAGPGFSLVHAEKASGLGLLSMRERAMIIGGSFQLKTSPGKGTMVLLTAPIGTHVAANTDPPRRRSRSDV